ncbi:MAG: hypothetical protein NWR83_11330 [Salibacteraceae bacterium]|nr:hypothetical protein [Salibacteraceae bacterium]MDP4845051.1 hypothetical protein [Salibacteraceae bacterium]
MHKKMRVFHRYLGFFLGGIMAVYAISGIVLIFRNNDTFKVENHEVIVLDQETPLEELGKALEIKRFEVEKTENNIVYFKEGTYDIATRTANITRVELPYALDKMTHLHKATSDRPLAFLNIFFGLSLFFFVVSSFWMFIPKSSIFKKGLYFSLAGLVLALVLIFV